MLRILPEHPHGSSAALTVALENLHRRGLAGPVGPEKREYLAPSHLEVDAPYRLHRPVAHVEVRDIDHEVVGAVRSFEHLCFGRLAHR